MKTAFKKKYVLPLNLQLFAEGDGGGEGAGAGEGAGGAGEGAGAGNGGAGAGQGSQGAAADNKPFATFPDEASFMSRVSRESKKQFNELLKSLGFEKEDDLKGVIKAHTDNLEAQKTELQKAQEAAATAATARTAAEERANKIATRSEAKVEALAAGVKPDRLEYVLKLADLSGVTVTDGVADGEAVKAAIAKVLTDMPELKGQAGAARGGGDFGAGQNNNGLLTLEMIKNFTTKEAEARLPEITAFLAKQKQ